MKPSDMQPTHSADAIVSGLIRTGRAHNHSERVGAVLRLARRKGPGFYWIDVNGHEVRRGETLLNAEPLQESFVAAMKASGRSPK